ncbi:MAG: hypothetical protein M3Y80_11285 [Verrucomicrobiota bacterium]|nr:hypothetical protein [Verrucomicrobiota bacterium]
MADFTDAAFLMLPSSEYEDDELLQQTVLVFLFGAFDALVQQFYFEMDEKTPLLRAYLQRTFSSFAPADCDLVISNLASASDDPEWIPIMQRGGQTLVDWGRGNSTAPLMLSHIVRFGIEDADMMRQTRSPK